jgi:hypothetical protein
MNPKNVNPLNLSSHKPVEEDVIKLHGFRHQYAFASAVKEHKGQKSHKDKTLQQQLSSINTS